MKRILKTMNNCSFLTAFPLMNTPVAYLISKLQRATLIQCCKQAFLEWPVIFSSEPGKDDQDQGVGWSSLKTPNEGPGA